MFFCTHPTIWNFLEALKKKHGITRMQLVRIRQLEFSEPRAAKCAKYNDRIQFPCESYHRLFEEICLCLLIFDILLLRVTVYCIVYILLPI